MLVSKRNIKNRFYGKLSFLPSLLIAIAVLSLSARGDEEGSTSAKEAVVAENESGASISPETTAPAEKTPPTTTNASNEEKNKRAPHWYRGMFESEVDSVIANGGSDLDFSQYLRIDADPPEQPRLHLRGSLWLHQDAGSDSGKPGTLRDINDASASDVQARLLYLYAGIDDALGSQSLLRVGRQRIQEGATYNRIDGLYIRKRYNKLEWYAFIGARASVYRDTSDDLVLGGGASFRPDSHTRIALDGYYAEESRYGLSQARGRSILGGFTRPIASQINDSKVTLSLWHNFGANTRAFARIGMLGSNLDELTLSLNGYLPRLDLLYDVNYRQLFNTVGDTTGDLSPFYQVLGQYREYQTLYVGLHRPLTESTTLSIEAEIRNAKNDDFYSGNRDFVRLGAVLYVDNVYKNFDISTSLEYWDASGGEGTWTITGEVSRTWEKVDWSAGLDFVRYKDRVIEYDRNAALLDTTLAALIPTIYPGFSYLTQANATRVVDTRESVYSIYTKVTWTFRDDQEVYARMSFEEDDGPDSPYWRIRAGYRLRF